MRKSYLIILAISIVGCSSGDSPDSTTTSTDNSLTTTAGGEQPVGDILQVPELKAILEQVSVERKAARFQEALRILGDAIADHPAHPGLYLLRADVYTTIGHVPSALKDLNSAIEVAENKSSAYNARGFFHLQNKNQNLAIADFAKSIQADGNNILAYNNRGLTYVALERFDEAIADFDHIVNVQPDNVDARNNRGYAHFKAGNQEQAISDFDAAIELDPNADNPYNNRGLVHFELKDFEMAARDFTEAIAVSPNRIKFYRHRQAAYLQLGHKEEADADGRKIAWLAKLFQINAKIHQNPQNPTLYVERARHYANDGQDQAVMNDFAMAMEVDKGFAQTYSARAAYWLSKGEVKNAIKDCDAAIKIEPHHEAYSVRGDAWFKKGDYELALKDFERAKRFDDTVAQAYLRHSEVLQTSGKANAAAEALEHAIALDPSLKTARQ